MSVILNINHEISSTVVDVTNYDIDNSAGHCAIVAGGLGGTAHALATAYDGVANRNVEKSNIATQNIIRTRFYIKPNSIAMGDGEYFFAFNLLTTSLSHYVIYVFLRYYAAAGYQVGIRAMDDGGNPQLYLNIDITNAEHYIEISEVRATTVSSADGTAQCWIDGANQGTATGIDNYNIMGDDTYKLRLGETENNAPTATGTYYLDEIVINNDGSLIGPLTTNTTTLITRKTLLGVGI
jgi:hypothetical protein